ncbi:MAG: hypothetical protein AB1941_05725 [Gemmatimonadota bacterium]
MSITIQEIERAVVELSPGVLAEFRAWFLEFDAAARDRQLVQDAAEGRFDPLAGEALEDLRASGTRWLQGPAASTSPPLARATKIACNQIVAVPPH